MTRWQEIVLAICWIVCFAGVGSIAVSYGILFIFFANSRQFPSLLVPIFLVTGAVLLFPLGRRVMSGANVIFSDKDADTPISMNTVIFFGWFLLLIWLYTLFFQAISISTNRWGSLGWGALWSVSILLGYRFVPSRSRPWPKTMPGPAGREFYIDHDE